MVTVSLTQLILCAVAVFGLGITIGFGLCYLIDWLAYRHYEKILKKTNKQIKEQKDERL